MTLKTRYLIIFLLLGAMAPHCVEGQHRFIENGGQWDGRVLYRTAIPGGKFYLEADRFTFDLYDVETTSAVFSAHAGNPNPPDPPARLKCHAYQMVFVDANPDAFPAGDQPFRTRYGFFKGSNPSKWAGNLSAYPGVNYSQLYPGIDLKVYSNAALKYDFIIEPGANPGLIKIEYEGVKPKINSMGQLEIKTSVGDVLESSPFAYQIVDGLKQKVECSYRLSGKMLQFTLGDYDPSKELIIDPELIFSTFSGSSADNFGYTATYDEEGHLYSGSSAFGTGYPVSVGAYQTSWAGGSGNGNAGTDIAITKFSLDGTSLIYSTYLGGSADDLPHSLIVNEADELYIFGTSGSADFPTTPGAYQSDFGGGSNYIPSGIGIAYINGSDMIVSRLSADGGALIGSTYMGGSENDGMNTTASLDKNYADEIRGEIELDPEGNPVVGSTTFSDDFPITPGAYQSALNGEQEGVLLRLNPDMTTLLHSTFLGGEGADAIYSIHATADGKITVGGGTNSTNMPVTPAAYQPTYGGGPADGFIGVFDQNFQSLEVFTYYGSEAYDQVYFVERDGNGKPHIYGQTQAGGSTFVENAGFAIPNSGMMLSSFTPNLQNRIWSTVFGNGVNVPSLSPTAFSVDICNRVYLSGWGGAVNGFGGTDGLPITNDAIQATTDNSDFYFMVMEADASALTFATYYGGDQSPEHVDGGTSRFDREGKIYQAACAGCHGNSDFPIYPDNAYSATNNSTNGCNLGVVKIDFDLPTVIADFEADSVCLPEGVAFENTSALYSGSNATYIWHFPNGDESFAENPIYVFDSPGTFDVELVVTDPEACNISDTVVKSVKVFPELTVALPDTVQSCTDSTFDITAVTNGSASYFTWAEDPEMQNIISEGATDSTLEYTAENVTEIYLHTTNGLCEQIDTVLISPSPVLNLSVNDTLICATGSLNVNYILDGGSTASSINWTPATAIISGQGSANVMVDISETINLEVEVETNFGCDLNANANIEVYPIALEVSADTLACVDDPIDLRANSFGRSQSFTWSDSNNFDTILNPGGDSIITVIPQDLTYYYVRVQNGDCILIDSVAVGLLANGTSISASQYICAGDTAWITVSNDFPGNQLNHEWQPEEFIISGQGTSQIRVLVPEATTFNVVSSTADGCQTENSTTIYISELGNQSVEAFADPQNITNGQTSNISAIPDNENYNYLWSPSESLANPNSATTTASPATTTSYIINIFDSNDNGVCMKSDTVTVFVFESICGEPNIFVPNTFTPNGDGENDRVWVRGGNITELNFRIFDRWGEKVFETGDQARGWDGTFLGNLAEPAVYVYYLDVKCGDGQDYFKKGNITLVR